MAAANARPSRQLELTPHCLLRLATALMLEAGGINHLHDCATDELNARTGRSHTASEWLEILAPAYVERFCPDQALRPRRAARAPAARSSRAPGSGEGVPGRAPGAGVR